ncbi:transposase, partial [Streptomyces sp. NBC_00091]|uniref:transposase n=1 Tax=Streptomyces sp. NBC_00091 TaxID=2975648 RepID=UPI002B1E8FCF
GTDLAAVTADQVREVVERLVAAGQWRRGDPEVLIVLDAGYNAPRIAHLPLVVTIAITTRRRAAAAATRRVTVQTGPTTAPSDPPAS